jgi:hypothetical protein
MSDRLDRRSFIRRSALTASAAGALTWQFEEKALAAQQVAKPTPGSAATPARVFPKGRIGKLEISRLICGGNLISGFAHSRDLIYVSRLLKSYFTDEKVLETLALCEAEGLNAMILRVDDDTARIIRKYRAQGGKLQWLAQCKLPEKDRWADINRAIDGGAAACYVHGGVGDSYVAAGRVDELGEAVDYIRKQGVVSGIAGHDIKVHMACEEAGLAADFYMKTYNSKQYWSAGPMPRHDSVWAETPEQTRAFMSEVEKPWIAYKVLGAGAIPPDQGFRYAFDGGADFICVGMFDFQVEDDAEFARRAIARARIRQRPWT